MSMNRTYLIEADRQVSKDYMRGYLEALGYKFDDSYQMELKNATRDMEPTVLYRIRTKDRKEDIERRTKGNRHVVGVHGNIRIV